jgi:hypothetical protein
LIAANPLLNSDGVRFIEAQDLAALERDHRFWIAQFFAVELDTALFDQATRISA